MYFVFFEVHLVLHPSLKFYNKSFENLGVSQARCSLRSWQSFFTFKDQRWRRWRNHKKMINQSLLASLKRLKNYVSNNILYFSLFFILIKACLYLKYMIQNFYIPLHHVFLWIHAWSPTLQFQLFTRLLQIKIEFLYFLICSMFQFYRQMTCLPKD